MVDAQDETPVAGARSRWLNWWAWGTLLGAILVITTVACVPLWRNYWTIEELKRIGVVYETKPDILVDLPGREWLLEKIEQIDETLPQAFEVPSAVLFQGVKTDADLICLQSLPEITVISFQDATLEGSGLSYLRPETRLKGAYFYRCHLNSAGLAHLSSQISLQVLALSDIPMCDAGMTHIGGLPNLRSLSISKTKVTDAGLVHLRGLNKLEFLHLANTQITDESSESFANLTNLQRAYLDHTRIGDATLEQLSLLPKLKYLSVKQTNVTKAGAVEFMRKRPDCELQFIIR